MHLLSAFASKRGLAVVFSLVAFATIASIARSATTLAIPLNQTAADPLLQNLNIPANAASAGMWSPTQSWPLNGLHVMVLPDGRVLTYGSPQGNAGTQDGRTHDYWQPRLGFGANSHQTTTSTSRPNSFCSTSAFLLDGRVIMTSGNSPFDSALVNPDSGSWTTDSFRLADQRWYASMVTLGDGRLVIVGGMDPYSEGMQNNPAGAIQAGTVSMTPEIYTMGSGWRSLLGATSRDAFGPDFLRANYPRAWLAPDGRVFGISADNMWYLDVNANSGSGAISIAGRYKISSASAPVNAGATGTAVMFAPGRILMVGGNGSFNGDPFPASNMASVVDINGSGPVVTDQARMTYPRRYPNAVVLPDGKVVVTGGTRFGNNGGADAVYPAEIWNPATGAWTVGASAAQIRVYHSSSVLLPNGTVLSTGGGAPGPVNNLNAEIYYPPYLFNANGTLAARPVMTGINSLSFNYGATLQIQMADAAGVSKLVMVRNGAMTHSFNNGQRLLPLNFSQSGDLTATLPASANQAPPGHYQVYALNANGVPSPSVIVSIGMAAAITPSYPALGPEWVSAGTTASRLAVSSDNTIVAIDPATALVSRKNGDDTTANWTTIAGKTLSAVAMVRNSTIWGVGTDQNVWRYNGSQWQQAGNTVRDIAASSDGTIVVVNSAANTLWRKSGDDTVQNWQNVAGTAKRVALVNGSSIWSIGMDDGIYRYDGTSWTRVGTGFARSLAASANGTIVYADRDSGQIWRKSGDNSTANWVQVAGQVPEVAVAQSGALWAVSGTGQVHRRAGDAQLPSIPALPAAPAVSGTSVSYIPGLEATGLTFSWNFGDGSPSTAFTSASAASYRFAVPGQYLVTLTVRNASGQTTSKTFIQAIYAAPIAGAPVASTPILIEPRSGASARVWVVNPDNNSVSVIDTANNARVAEITVGKAPRTLTRAADGSIWVANRDSNSISVISSSSLGVTRTISLPRASQPYAVVAAATGEVYVSLQATGQVLKLSSAGATLATFAAGANPRHLSLSANGAQLLVSRFITPMAPGEATLTVSTAGAGGEVLNVNTANMTLSRISRLQFSDATDTSTQGAGVPNYLGAAVISPDGASAWVPSKQDNIRRGTARNGQNLNFQNTVRAISSRIDLASGAELLGARVDHDNASVASAAAFDRTGSYLFVALETSRQVAVVNPIGNVELFRIDVGLAPQGVAVSSDGLRLYVQNFMSRTVTVADISPLTRNGEFRATTVATVNAVGSELLASTVLRGKQFFYDAADPRLSRDAYMSCAACHNDGAGDGRVWDLTGFGEGLRRTIDLRGRGAGQGFLHWSANFDEVQDFEGQIRTLSGGTGLMSDAQFNTGTRSQPLGDRKTGVSADLDALASYLASLGTFAASPFRAADGARTSAGVAGRTVFTTQNCQSCHGGAAFTVSADAAQLKSIGTVTPASGSRLGGPLTGVDVPTLRSVWSAGPYLHDGSAADLRAAIAAHQGVSLNTTDFNNLIEFVRQIDGSEPAIASGVAAPPTVSLTSPAGGSAFTTGTAITLTATATASSGRTISSVAFLLNGSTVLSTRTTSPYTFSWTGAAAGTHSITARATDNTGAVTTSSAVSITVGTAGTADSFISTIVSVRTSKCIAISGSSTADAAGAVQQTCSTVSSQRFRFDRVSGTTDVYTITATHSSKLLDVNGASRLRGATIIQWPAHGGTNQRFRLNLMTDGTYSLRPMHSALYVKVRNGASTEGAIIEQNNSTNSGETRWRLPGRP